MHFEWPWLKFLATHRCNLSLKHGVSIRYQHVTDLPAIGPGWFLFYTHPDPEYDTTHLTRVCQIYHCPFCGQKLEVPQK